MQPPAHRAVRVEEVAPIHPWRSRRVFARGTCECLLENPGPPSALGRHSLLGVDPLWILRGRGPRCEGGPPDRLAALPGDPLVELAALLARYRDAGAPSDGPPTRGGALGYLGYELAGLLERLPARHARAAPDLYLAVYGTLLVTDHLAGRSWLVATGLEDEAGAASAAAERRLRDALVRLRGVAAEDDDAALVERRAAALDRRPRLAVDDLAAAGVRPTMPRDAYLRMVEIARQRILRGDLYEVCTSQRLDAAVAATGEELYRVARAINPAPFAAYLRFAELEVVSSSPERFLRLERDGSVETRPVKGTRPRGRTEADDDRLAAELLASEKDRAENLMIVDLARNDLGRVCATGSISVPELHAIERHPFTHQLVSTVRGRLADGRGAVDLLRAAFPGGSMTGAPKIAAMRLIDELEPVARGVFAGAIGHLDFDGALDLSIVIRTLVVRGAAATLHVGGAIVADSDPAAEYQETLDKAHALVLALELARG